MDDLKYKNALIKIVESLINKIVPEHNKSTDVFKDLIYSLPHYSIDELEGVKKVYEEMISAKEVAPNSLIKPIYRYRSYIYN